MNNIKYLLTTTILILVGASQISAQNPAVNLTQNETASVLFYENISRITNTYCISCHNSTSSHAPFSLTRFEDVKSRAWASLDAIQSRKMPPYKQVADGSCGEWKDSAWLSNADIELFTNWVLGGMQKGDPKNEFPKSPATPGLSEDEVHLIAQMNTDYMPDANSASEFRCFLLDGITNTNQFIQATEIVPNELAHHIFIFTIATKADEDKAAKLDRDDPKQGYSCFNATPYGHAKDGKTVVINSTLVSGWAQGSTLLRLPNDSGFKLAANRKMIAQVHYMANHHLPASISKRNIKLGVKVKLASNVKTELTSYELAKGDLSLPPFSENGGNDIIQEKIFSAAVFPKITPNTSAWISVFAPHMHQFGQRIKLERIRSGANQCISFADFWDHEWQRTYLPNEAIEIKYGDELKLTCVYKNETENRIGFGIDADSEMCMNYLVISYGKASP